MDIFGFQQMFKTPNTTFVLSKGLNDFIGNSVHICICLYVYRSIAVYKAQ